MNRREFLTQSTAASVGAALAGSLSISALAQDRGERPPMATGVEVLNPRGRVPVSLIIDDSTCLVNLAHFAIPHFAEAFPDRYTQDWRKLPREIPDSFVRKFGEWCHEHGVKGKYSIVPHPACVGWVDRDMPGWTRKELEDSLKLVRDLIVPDWDIHPEMVTHTWAIDTKTGRPYPERSERSLENWGFSVGRSVDFLADYIGYALRILKNAGLPCEGMTTPGGFGNRVLPQLAQATLEACRDVYQTEIPHYFRHLFTDDQSVAPRIEYASGLDTDDPKCVVSVIGCTGDWFGGWDGLEPPDADKYIAADLNGRVPEIIARGEPAVMVCHWPGIYCNGGEEGFQAFQTVVERLHRRYDNLIWMKNSEIARYWAAKELTKIEREGSTVILKAPFACPAFTVRYESQSQKPPIVHVGNERQSPTLNSVSRVLDLKPGTFFRDGKHVTACFDLPKGESRVAA
jgi:hypothetical protein